MTDYYGFVEIRDAGVWKSAVNLGTIFSGDKILGDLANVSKKDGVPPVPSEEVRKRVEKLLSLPGGSEVFQPQISEEDWNNPDFDFSTHNLTVYWFDGVDIGRLSDEEREKMSTQFRTVLNIMDNLIELKDRDSVRAFVYSTY